MKDYLKSEMSGMSKMKEDKGSGKITSMNIRVLDDGTYNYCVYTDKGKSAEYSAGNMEKLMSMLHDDLGSPHLRMKKKKKKSKDLLSY